MNKNKFNYLFCFFSINRLEQFSFPLLLFIGLIIVVNPLLFYEFAYGTIIPEWVKKVFRWYVDDQISEEELIKALQYLVNKKILSIPEPTNLEFPKDVNEFGIELLDGKKTSEPKFISNFDAGIFDDGLLVQFSLFDGYSDYTRADGFGYVLVKNSKGESIFEGNINIRKEDFFTYQDTETNEVITSYLWEPLLHSDEMSRFVASTMFLEFSSEDYIFETIPTSIWDLRSNTNVQLAKATIKEFNENAIMLGKKVDVGSFNVLIERAGYFAIENQDSGKLEEYFRVDMEITNQRNVEELFNPQIFQMVDGKNNFYREVGGSLGPILDVPPKGVKSGYLLFEKIPDNMEKIKILFPVGYDSNFQPYNIEFEINLSSKTDGSFKKLDGKEIPFDENLIIEFSSESKLFQMFSYADDLILLPDGSMTTDNMEFELKEEMMDEYEEIALWNDPQKTVVINPIFTSTAYFEPGFYTYFREECDFSCLTKEIDYKKSSGYTASIQAVKILKLLGYEIITDIHVDKNPKILEDYDKVIVLHNEYVTQKEFEAITNHPKVIYLYPNSNYAQVEVDYEKNTVSLVRGHGYPPDDPVSNGFNWKYEELNHPWEYNTECKDWEFIKVDNGYMLDCYPELILSSDRDLLKMIKNLD